MGSDTVVDLLNLSQKRYDILCLICEGTLDKAAVEERIDSSRPTVDRAYREFEEMGILNSTGTSYDLTNFGALYCEEFSRVRETLETIDQIREILSYLPSDSTIDMRLLEGADVQVAKEHAPQEPFMEVVNVALDADSIVGYSSTVMPNYVDVFYSLVVDSGIETTLVFTDDVVEVLRDNYADEFDDLTAADNATIHSTPRIKTYGLLMADDTIAVPVGHERDRLQAVILNDTEAAAEWGQEYLDRLIGAEDAYEL
jgi:predicted transcriptional regulator